MVGGAAPPHTAPLHTTPHPTRPHPTTPHRTILFYLTHPPTPPRLPSHTPPTNTAQHHPTPTHTYTTSPHLTRYPTPPDTTSHYNRHRPHYTTSPHPNPHRTVSAQTPHVLLATCYLLLPHQYRRNTPPHHACSRNLLACMLAISARLRSSASSHTGPELSCPAAASALLNSSSLPGHGVVYCWAMCCCGVMAAAIRVVSSK